MRRKEQARGGRRNHGERRQVGEGVRATDTEGKDVNS